MQFWSWRVSLSPYSSLLSIESRFPLPLFQKKKEKKKKKKKKECYILLKYKMSKVTIASEVVSSPQDDFMIDLKLEDM